MFMIIKVYSSIIQKQLDLNSISYTKFLLCDSGQTVSKYQYQSLYEDQVKYYIHT